MDIFKPFRKCFLCKQTGNGLKWVSQYGIYMEANKHYAYHPECLKAVLCDPEKYGHEIVDMALQIACLVKDEKEEEKRAKAIMKKEQQENIEKAKKLCEDF